MGSYFNTNKRTIMDIYSYMNPEELSTLLNRCIYDYYNNPSPNYDMKIIENLFIELLNNCGISETFRYIISSDNFNSKAFDYLLTDSHRK